MATMIDCGSDAATALARLTTPARNRYYYGKLLDAEHFELEQEYGNRKRWLLNRLSLGTGVLCGLDVSVVQGANGSQIVVGPGVAIDGVGRELIVPAPSAPINPLQATDECGQPAGTALTGPTRVTLYICYHECEAEPAPVMVSQCGPDRACECGVVRERYRLQIRAGAPERLPIDCGTIFDAPGAGTTTGTTTGTSTGTTNMTGGFTTTTPSGTPPTQTGTPGAPATPTTSGGLTVNDPYVANSGTTRRQLLCRLLDRGCATPTETCVPLAEIAIDANGGVLINQCIARTMVYSNAVLLDLILCLAERVDACCGGSTGGTPPTVTLPVVTAIWPPTGAILARDQGAQSQQWLSYWLKPPHIQLTFSEPMNVAELQAPDPWLAVFACGMPSPAGAGGNVAPITRLALAYSTSTSLKPGAPATGTTVNYQIGGQKPDNSYFLVLIQPGAGAIQDTDSPANTLAADYAGTQFSAADLATCWALAPGANGTLPAADLAAAFVATGATLPSGADGVAGGTFSSWFAVIQNS
jgi:hypothetical protein